MTKQADIALAHLSLGKITEYVDQYDASLLQAVPRQLAAMLLASPQTKHSLLSATIFGMLMSCRGSMQKANLWLRSRQS